MALFASLEFKRIVALKRRHESQLTRRQKNNVFSAILEWGVWSTPREWRVFIQTSSKQVRQSFRRKTGCKNQFECKHVFQTSLNWTWLIQCKPVWTQTWLTANQSEREHKHGLPKPVWMWACFYTNHCENCKHNQPTGHGHRKSTSKVFSVVMVNRFLPQSQHACD